MFNICPQCGHYQEKKQVDPAGPTAICPTCGHAHPFKQLPLFVITGASGAGKSTLGLALSAQLTRFVVLEGDIFWRDEFNQPVKDFHPFRNLCLRVAKNINQAGRPTILVGSSTPGEYEACPEARYFASIHYLALVCDKDVLADRLRQRPSFRHASAPEFIQTMQNYNDWFIANANHPDFDITLLDTTHLTVPKTVAATRDWLG